jgi:hypothetical protein
MKKKTEVKPAAEKPEFKPVKELNRPKFRSNFARPISFTRVRSFGGHR